LDLVFELGGRELGLKIIRLLAGLLHGFLDLTEHLLTLAVSALVTAGNRRMIWRKVPTLLCGRQRCSAQGCLTGED
jgi:hypothetical protein